MARNGPESAQKDLIFTIFDALAGNDPEGAQKGSILATFGAIARNDLKSGTANA